MNVDCGGIRLKTPPKWGESSAIPLKSQSKIRYGIWYFLVSSFICKPPTKQAVKVLEKEVSYLGEKLCCE